MPKSLCNGYLHFRVHIYYLSIKKCFTLLNIAAICVVIFASVGIGEFVEKGSKENVRASSIGTTHTHTQKRGKFNIASGKFVRVSYILYVTFGEFSTKFGQFLYKTFLNRALCKLAFVSQQIYHDWM